TGSGPLALASGGSSSFDQLNLVGGATTVDAGTVNLTSSAFLDALQVGNAASLVIASAAVVNANAPGDVLIDGSTAGLRVTGANSRLSSGSRLYIGYLANGSLTVDAGASVANGGLLVAGVSGGSSGQV